MDRELIRNIPLATRRQNDFRAWHYEKTGIFSVCFAYRMFVESRERRIAWLDEKESSSSGKREENEWLAIWKIWVPAKIPVFLWCLARQSLQTADVRAPSSEHGTTECLHDLWAGGLLGTLAVRV
jgi:hypothetical protein